MFSKIINRNSSVLYSWFFSYICILFVPILIGLYLYNSSYAVIKSTTGKVHSSTLNQAAIQADNMIRETSAILGQLLGDEDVQRLSATSEEITPEGHLRLIALTARMQKLITTHPGIEDIYVILKAGGSVVSTKGHMSEELFSSLYLDDEYSIESFGKLYDEIILSRGAVKVVGHDKKEKLLFGKRTLNTGLGHDCAAVVVQWDLNSFMNTFTDNEKMYFFITDENDNIVASNYQDSDDNKIKGEIISLKSSETRWKYNYMISTDIYEKSAKSIEVKTIISLLLCMVIGIFMSLRMSKKNYNPVKNLLELTGNGSAKNTKNVNEYKLLEDRIRTYLETKASTPFVEKKDGCSVYEKFCEEIKLYVKDQYKDPDLNISQAAIHFNLTPSYLSMIFKKETGVSLLSYISNVRTDAAKEELKGTATIADIAESTGFRDSAALIRTFKKNVGMTPGQFRDQL